eukprot:TRINITY_DN9479_c0_g1_i1.p1 TRINITY_DN9479_c0_g1~~TRINITY_DN9479_c0_g1_i1.p1  ORF type:complete len:448 (+),score=141.12 TRINITY_DN9479_c0_g1_i1:78-1346(+)
MAWTGRALSHGDFDWDHGRCIGVGAVSRVFLLRYLPDGELYAVKALSKAALISRSSVESAFNEKRLLQAHCSTGRVATLYGTFQTDEYLYFVLEYCPRGNVEMLALRHGALPRRLVAHICACVTVALEAIHRSGWVVRDVKPENCCFDAAGFVSLIDFDTALRASEPPKPMLERTKSIKEIPPEERYRVRSAEEINAMRRKTQLFTGTAQYISPEMLDSCSWSYASDLWALGCICYVAACGRPPFNAPSQFEVFRRVVRGTVDYPEDMDPQCADFCQRLLVTDPCSRLGVGPGPGEPGFYDAIRAHPLFEGIDWELYRQKRPAPFDFAGGPAPEEDGEYIQRMADPDLHWNPWEVSADPAAEADAQPSSPEPTASPASPSPASSPRHADPTDAEEEGGEDEGGGAEGRLQFRGEGGGRFVFP